MRKITADERRILVQHRGVHRVGDQAGQRPLVGQRPHDEHRHGGVRRTGGIVPVGAHALSLRHGETRLRRPRRADRRAARLDHAVGHPLQIARICLRHHGVGAVAEIIDRHRARVGVRRGDRDRVHRHAGLDADPAAHLAAQLLADKDQVVRDDEHRVPILPQIQRGAFQPVVDAGARALDVGITKKKDGILRGEVRRGRARKQGGGRGVKGWLHATAAKLSPFGPFCKCYYLLFYV
jgi:hypothetical protein